MLLILDWRSGKLGHHSAGPKDPPFTHPASLHGGGESYSAPADDEGDEEEAYSHIPPVTSNHTSYTGAHDNSNHTSSPFADPQARYSAAANDRYDTPGVDRYGTPPAQARPSMDAYGAFSDPAPSGFAPAGSGPGVSRTMQYADPYAAVRASIAGPPAPASSGPPSYEGYAGYR